MPGTVGQAAATDVAAATSAPTPASTSASRAEPARTATVAPAGDAESATETTAATVTPELAAEVSTAYALYWQVLADADYLNDPSSLDQVAAGEQLDTLRKDIAEDQSQGRATRVRVQHSFLVASVHGDRAEVDDHLQDLSIFVDPTSHDPLPGEVEPTSVDSAPTFDAKFQLQLIDGTWKVTSAARVEGSL
jgi:hypothetical protein